MHFSDSVGHFQVIFGKNHWRSVFFTRNRFLCKGRRWIYFRRQVITLCHNNFFCQASSWMKTVK